MKKFLALVLVLAVVFSVAIAGTITASADYDKIILTMTVNGSDTPIDTKVGQKFA